MLSVADGQGSYSVIDELIDNRWWGVIAQMLGGQEAVPMQKQTGDSKPRSEERKHKANMKMTGNIWSQDTHKYILL